MYIYKTISQPFTEDLNNINNWGVMSLAKFSPTINEVNENFYKHISGDLRRLTYCDIPALTVSCYKYVGHWISQNLKWGYRKNSSAQKYLALLDILFEISVFKNIRKIILDEQ